MAAGPIVTFHYRSSPRAVPLCLPTLRSPIISLCIGAGQSRTATTAHRAAANPLEQGISSQHLASRQSTATAFHLCKRSLGYPVVGFPSPSTCFLGFSCSSSKGSVRHCTIVGPGTSSGIQTSRAPLVTELASGCHLHYRAAGTDSLAAGFAAVPCDARQVGERTWAPSTTEVALGSRFLWSLTPPHWRLWVVTPFALHLAQPN